MRSRLSAAKVAQAVRSGDRRALARAISLIERKSPTGAELARRLYRSTGNAHVIGITGPLGVGKSSVINHLLADLRTKGTTVAVVAVDPSSPFSGGSVLGDRIRLERPVDDAGSYVRSMASRGSTGGVAPTTRDVVRLLDAAGFGIVLLETVGSGQVDVEVREIATTSVVVVVPHLGDEVQTLKAGLFEIADVFCVNKSDLAGADQAAKDLEELVALSPGRDGWRPRVVRTSTIDGAGVEALWTAIEAHEDFLARSGRRQAIERERIRSEITEIMEESFRRALEGRGSTERKLDRLVEEVVRRKTDPRTAAKSLYRSWKLPS